MIEYDPTANWAAPTMAGWIPVTISHSPNITIPSSCTGEISESGMTTP
jgi:hypothetical protein